MTFIRSLFRTKPVDHHVTDQNGLRRCLTAFDLTILGIGAIVGAGVFVLTGIAAATQAGPAIVLSYVLAGLACAFSALAYAELSASIGGCGSAYGYSFAGLGEIIAWLIGWDLLLEYAVACSAVAIGWSGYVQNALAAAGWALPASLTKNVFEGGFVNLPAVGIVALISLLLGIGVRESTRINRIIVFIKLAVIALFIILASSHFDPKVNWHPFLPFGWLGVAHGASLIFFAYIGFDAVSTAAEEAINPKRDLPIGIICSLLVCTIIYIVVAGLLTGVVPYTQLNVSSPVSFALLQLGYRFGSAVVAVGAIAGLSTVILVMNYGLTRICFAMARDGLLPIQIAKLHPKTKTPVRIICIAGVIMIMIAGFMPIHQVAELTNIGTLTAFALVCLGVIWMRYTKPDMPRPFKTPFSPLIPALGVIFCVYLMLNLSSIVWRNFTIWMVIGLVIYFAYSRKRSILAKQ
jgi:APA family basic amino acid/polyamine antiporter